MGKARTNLPTALIAREVRDNLNAPFSISTILYPLSGNQILLPSHVLQCQAGWGFPWIFFFLRPASWEVLCWSSAACGCKLNCDKYTEQCIAWRLKSMLACAQTKLFFTCSSFKWSHFKGAAYFVVCMHCFFLPEEKYQNNKSSLEEVLPCLVISWEIFFYLYNMQILLRHMGNRNWLV